MIINAFTSRINIIFIFFLLIIFGCRSFEQIPNPEGCLAGTTAGLTIGADLDLIDLAVTQYGNPENDNHPKSKIYALVRSTVTGNNAAHDVEVKFTFPNLTIINTVEAQLYTTLDYRLEANQHPINCEIYDNTVICKTDVIERSSALAKKFYDICFKIQTEEIIQDSGNCMLNISLCTTTNDVDPSNNSWEYPLQCDDKWQPIIEESHSHCFGEPLVDEIPSTGGPQDPPITDLADMCETHPFYCNCPPYAICPGVYGIRNNDIRSIELLYKGKVIQTSRVRNKYKSHQLEIPQGIIKEEISNYKLQYIYN